LKSPVFGEFLSVGILILLAVGCGSSRQTAERPKEPELKLDSKQWERESIEPETEERKLIGEEDRSKPKGSRESELEAFVDPWIGVPYRYAGSTRQGVDCSGFVCMVYREYYKDPFKGRRSEDLFAEVDPIDQGDLQAGDLVFFKIRGGRIDHVGVYLGQGEFVHSSTQRGVIRSRLDEEYYKKRFFKGGRKR